MLPSFVEEKIKVVVKERPFNRREKENYHITFDSNQLESCLKFDHLLNQLSFSHGIPDIPTRIRSKTFKFDGLYDMSTLQIDFYNRECRCLVDAALNGDNVTIFTYGETGTGKTFTMSGVLDDESYSELRGIIPNAAEHIFHHISKRRDRTLSVRVSYLEIYNDKVYDLLDDSSSHNTKTRMRMMTSDVSEVQDEVENLRQIEVEDFDDVVDVFKKYSHNHGERGSEKE
mmetsp:Transcript_2538/g.3106  ORF Transcript_2538/g.3106 Transcript_2538/m.3106 type:complete len:229 (-) Transcript_2538:1093-1779(-)